MFNLILIEIEASRECGEFNENVISCEQMSPTRYENLIKSSI